MPTPSEHKTVQARILKYAENIGWKIVPREEAEQRRGFDLDVPLKDRAKGRSLFFDDQFDTKVREFNPRYNEDKGSLLNHFGNFHTNISGNRNFVEHLRNHGKFLDHDENRELDLILIDYDDPKRNVFEVTEEWAFHNGHYSTREVVVFLINGIPVLVIECKNATKDEAIALGVDQIRRYHIETPELFVPEQIFTATDAIGFSYGVTWNTVRRNIFNWKDAEVGKLDQLPKILIVTEKLLTGFDAPLLYAMYLDKPMRDHTLLQAIARVNRPYENEAQEMVKPHGFVLDFVGIFDKLEKALAFDSDEVNAIVKDIKLLKLLFKNKMEQEAPQYLDLIKREFNDKDVDTLIEHFRDPERRKRFFKEYYGIIGSVTDKQQE